MNMVSARYRVDIGQAAKADTWVTNNLCQMSVIWCPGLAHQIVVSCRDDLVFMLLKMRFSGEWGWLPNDRRRRMTFTALESADAHIAIGEAQECVDDAHGASSTTIEDTILVELAVTNPQDALDFMNVVGAVEV